MFHNNNIIINVLELSVNRKLNNMQADNKSIHELVLQNPEFISQLDFKLHPLKDEHRKHAVG